MYSFGRFCSWPGADRGLGLGTPVGWTPAAIAGVVAGLGAGIAAYIGLAKIARPAVVKHAVPLKAAITEADQLVEQNKDWVKIEFESKLKALDEGRRRRLKDAEEEMARRVAEFQSRQQKHTEDADKVYPAKLEDIRRIHDEGMKKVEDKYPPRITALKEKYEKDRRQVDESYQQTKATTQDQYKQTWDKLIKDWTEGMARISGVVGDVRDEAGRRFLDWHRPDLDGWKPPTEVPPGLRFGAFSFDLDQFPGGSPAIPGSSRCQPSLSCRPCCPFPFRARC